LKLAKKKEKAKKGKNYIEEEEKNSE